MCVICAGFISFAAVFYVCLCVIFFVDMLSSSGLEARWWNECTNEREREREYVELGEHFSLRFFILFDGLAVNVPRMIQSNKIHRQWKQIPCNEIKGKNILFIVSCIFGLLFLWLFHLVFVCRCDRRNEEPLIWFWLRFFSRVTFIWLGSCAIIGAH